MKIRLVTFNLAGLQKNWWTERAPMTIEGFRQYEPDIVCLQEATIRGGSSFYDQSRALGAAVGLTHSAFAPYGNVAEVTSNDQGGVSILSRWPLQSARNLRLPSGLETHGDFDARVALLTEIATPIGLVGVVTTHLSWPLGMEDLRLLQLTLIERHITGFDTAIGENSIIAGDFNATEDEPVIRFANQRWKDAWKEVNHDEPGHTWMRATAYIDPGPFQDRRVDYIFCPKPFTVTACARMFDHCRGGPPSDHFGLFAEFEPTTPASRNSETYSP